MKPLVGVSGVSVRRRRSPRPALDQVSITADSGIVAVAGANGAGKSTLLRAIAGLLAPTSGVISVDGHRLSDRRGRAESQRLVSYLPQAPDFPRSFTVTEAVTYAGWLQSVPSPAARAEEIMGELRLLDRAHDRLGRLSGGTRQRVYLAQAVTHRPRVLLLDEPTSGMDVEHRRMLGDYLRNDDRRPELVLMSTHLATDIQGFADRVIVLSDGGVAFDGSTDELSARADTDTSSGSTDRIEDALLALGVDMGHE